MATCNIGAYQATPPSEADLAAQYVLQPSPIAPPATLASGQTVAATVYTETYTGAVAPDVPLYLSLTGGIGSASVGGVALTATPQLFTSGRAGRVVVQYTAGTPLTGSGTDTITVADAATSPLLAHSRMALSSFRSARQRTSPPWESSPMPWIKARCDHASSNPRSKENADTEVSGERKHRSTER